MIMLVIGISIALIIFGLVACLAIVMSWNESAYNLLNPKNQDPRNEPDNEHLKNNKI